jgi:hypothetical protein
MFCASPEPLKLCFGPRQFLTRHIPLAKEIVPFSDQRRRDCDIARTRATNYRVRGVLTGAEWTDR